MKLRTLSLVLFAACGGGGGDPVILIDAPDAGSTFSNTKNDMVYVSFGNMMTAVVQTPAEDVPDNNANPLTIGTATGHRITGIHGVGGDTGDDYVERDTYLITTGPDTDQLTIRLDWDGETADLDYFLFTVPATPQDEPLEVTRGTLISNVNNEFRTVNVEPNTSYWLWAGAFNMNADDGMAPGSNPVLPREYDLSIYGSTFAGADVGACNFTEAADATNDRMYVAGAFDPMNATGTAEASGQVLTSASHVFCGTINNNFVADAQDPSFGYVDVDTFSLTVPIDVSSVVTISGATPADDLALQDLLGFEVRVLNSEGLFLENAFFLGNHGALSLDMRASTAMTEEGDPIGVVAVAIIAYGTANLTTPINYKIKVSSDMPDTRAPRLSTAADVTEANDE
jgi:hypothetical protein